MANLGYDYFVDKPGNLDEWRCRICGSIATVTRNVFGPTSTASSLAKVFVHHDIFVCPHADVDWHHQAYRLLNAIEETPSKRLAALIQQDLDDLLQEHV
jgi:hypothetical protein